MKLKVPESINDITLKQFQDFVKLEAPTDYDVMRIFYGLDKKQADLMMPEDVEELVLKINNLLDKEYNDLTMQFKLQGINFGFIPNLDDMTYGELTDLRKYVNDIEQLHRAMAVLFRQITNQQFGKYLIEKYEGSDKYADTLQQMPLGFMLGAKVFFYNLTNDLLSYIPRYIQEEASRTGTQKNGEIIQLCTDLQEATSSGLMKRQNLMYTIV